MRFLSSRLLYRTRLAVLASLVLMTIASSKAQAIMFYPDPVFPVPLTSSLPFPWETIEGIWQAQMGGQPSLFSFKVLNDSNGRKTLRVVQLDSAAKVVVAEGRGIIDEKTNTARAMMASKTGPFFIFLGTYKNETRKELPPVLTILTIRSVDNAAIGSSAVIEKITGQPYAEPAPMEKP